MPDLQSMTPGQVLADASVADFITSLGLGIAEAQTALDANSINQLPEFVRPIDSLGGRSLIELGLSPAFYHYQHADLSCSLQLTLKVSENLSVGVGVSGSYGAGGESSSSDSSSTSETESGSSTSTTERTAEMEVTSSSTGTIGVGGRDFPLTGPDALARIRTLQDAVTADDSAGVARLLYDPPRDSFEITTDAPEDQVATTERTVAFLGTGFARGILRIDADADTSYRLNDSLTVDTTAQGDLDAYADHVAALIDADPGFEARAYPAGTPIARIFFETGRHRIVVFTAEGELRNDGALHELQGIADMSRQRGTRLRIVGHTDQQPYPGGAAVSDEANLALGQRRADAVRDQLLAYRAPAGNLDASSNGVADARRAGGPADQVRWRNADILFDPPMATVLVRATNATARLEGVTPEDLTAPPDTGNAWVHVFNPRPLELSGRSVTIDGTAFALSGAAGGGAEADTPEAHAHQLAASINAESATGFTASADGNVVTVYGKDSPFTLTLYTTESRQMRLSGSEGVTVTREFTRTSESSSDSSRESKSTVAFGATVDVRYARQFESTVTGNSSITARLTSIPAPPQFLEVVQDYLAEDG